jgi:hypothetical protein
LMANKASSETSHNFMQSKASKCDFAPAVVCKVHLDLLHVDSVRYTGSSPTRK